MEDRNCELLFEYLRSILYDSEVKASGDRQSG